jgi:cytochrome c556
LILAESGNLLLMRPSDDDQADWEKYSVEVRKLGGELYRAAKAKDYEQSRTHYEAMLKSCNACHDQFAGGEYQLKP